MIVKRDRECCLKMQWKVRTPDAEVSGSWPMRESEGGDTFQMPAWVLPTRVGSAGGSFLSPGHPLFLEDKMTQKQR